jgi:hypothetical protein
MDSFEDWVKNQTHPCLQTWAERLLELGASWDSFRRDSREVVQDLVDGGIPKLAARDVVNIASETLSRNQAPMAIFWDLENLAIPSSSSGRDVATRLKQILAPHGSLQQFRGYASIGEGNIPQQKRSDLQLSGCTLVDCPHAGRKEVVDKTIIVDAMQFAYEHPQGATLCLITGDIDYAYLLAVLQKKPQWRTIIISRGTIRSMLHVNCDMKMRWETDILQMRLAPTPAPSSTGTEALVNSSQVDGDDDEEEADDPNSRELGDLISLGEEDEDIDLTEQSQVSLEALTRDEEWDDDLELLRMAIRSAPFSCGGGAGEDSARKSHVGNTLRQTNPARFPNRDAVKDFLATVIENKIVTESGEGAFKMLTLSAAGFRPTMPVSGRSPVTIDQMPEKALAMTSSLPFVLFVAWYLCPKDEDKKFPDRVFIQSIPGKWAIVMFHNLRDVLRGVAAYPWLRSGRLVDWRLVTSGTHELQQTAIGPSTLTCSICNEEELSPPEEAPINGQGLCSVCAVSLTVDWVETHRAPVIDHVIQVLQMMAANDEVYVKKNFLRKALILRWPDECSSNRHAALWIHEALIGGTAIEFNRPHVNGRVICVKSTEAQAKASFPPENMKTDREERFVFDLLFENHGWMRRTAIIAALVEQFPDTMKTPVLRNRAVMNAAQKGLFFVAKGPYGHTVALIRSDAHDTLKLLGDCEKEEEKKEPESIDSSAESSESTEESASPDLVD